MMTSITPTHLLYQIENLPIFQNRMYDSELSAKNCPKGDVRLVQNLDTGLIYNELFNPEVMQYDQDYQNEQGYSSYFQKHLYDVALIVEKFLGKEDLIEVGCGKGLFLEMLTEKQFNIRGFDPTYEGENPNIERKYFSSDVGLHGKGIILRHVLEHIKNPIDFLFQLKESNGGTGKIYIEVPCFDWICKHEAWFDIFYEHVNYFRLSDFYNCFDEILDSGKVFGDQYLYVVAKLETLRKPLANSESDIISHPLDFLKSVKKNIQSNQDKLAIWGGASKGVIFSLIMSRLGAPINTVIDINPAKQYKYLPATGLKVHPPNKVFDLLPVGSTIYIMNSNYLEEIKEMSNHLYNYVCIDYV